MSAGRWEHFNHGADIGVRGTGATRSAAFEQAALALTAVVTDPPAVAANREILIKCEAPDDDLLLVEWLNALIYEMAVQRMLFGRFEVRLDGGSLSAHVWGEPVDVEKHRPRVEVKGATFTELRVRQMPDGSWSAQCVVDV